MIWNSGKALLFLIILKVLKTVEPATRKSGVKVANVAELVSKLKTEAGVI